MKTIHWGILGCGDVTEVKSGPAFQKAGGSELVAVMRRDGAKARDYAARHGVSTWYDDADALIGDPRVDAVYIATPPGAHLELALKVAAAGKPCYVEKPMARSHRECRLMNEAFERAGVPLFVAYYRRAMPRFVKAKELIDAGRLGTVTTCRYYLARPEDASANAHWRTNVEQSGGGLFLDVGSHVLDLLDYLLGEFVKYAGHAKRIERDDGSKAAPLHSDGDYASLFPWPDQESLYDGRPENRVGVRFSTATVSEGLASWNFVAARAFELLRIEGTEGTLELEVMGRSPLKLDRGGVIETFEIADPQHVQQPLIQSVVDALLGIGECPSTGKSAARTSDVMDAALCTYYEGRDDAFWVVS